MLSQKTSLIFFSLLLFDISPTFATLVPLKGVTAIATGINHTCALLNTGGVQCWGWNELGQLGNGTTTNSSTPVTVTGLNSSVTAIAAGYSHTCALLTTGEVQCWGNDGFGQLGNGNDTTTENYIPVTVTGLSSDVTAIATSVVHTCALLSTGGVQCWGSNQYGQLGNGTAIDSGIPVTVTGLTGVSAIAVGASHTCALLNTDEIQCWGRNDFGQLGNSTATDSLTPVAVTGLTGVSAIAAGRSHTCAFLGYDDEIQCWGNNEQAQLGNDTTTGSLTPITVGLSSSGVTAITAGYNHTCVLVFRREVQCWGYNGDGQLGNGTTTDSTTPVSVMVGDSTYTLTLDQIGTGSGTISGGGDFAAGTIVNLTATLNVGSTFNGWTPEPCAASFAMPDEALTCTATFTAETPSQNNCDAQQHAVFDPQTGMMTIPAVDIPMLDPIMGIMTGTLAVFTGKLKIAEGIEDFQLVPESLIYLNDIAQHDACHAEYTYTIDLFNKGGLLHLPFVEVPRVMLIPPDLQVPLGPTQIFEVTLRQLAIDPTVFHIEHYQFLQVK